MLTAGDTLAAVVSGAIAAVEVRLVLDGKPSAMGYRYVVGVTLDGKPHDWRALTSTPDTTVRWGTEHLGDRDRIEIPLAPGSHEVGVYLLAGHGSRVLARIRQSNTRED